MNETYVYRKNNEVEVSKPLIYREAYTRVLSRAVSSRLSIDSETMDNVAKENAVFQLVTEYGVRSLLLAPKDGSLSTMLARNSMEISDGVLLVNGDVSIPLAKFIRLGLSLEPFFGDVPESMQAFAEDKKKMVSDLTNIPVEKLSEIYEEVFNFISHLLSVHSFGAQGFYTST